MTRIASCGSMKHRGMRAKVRGGSDGIARAGRRDPGRVRARCGPRSPRRTGRPAPTRRSAIPGGAHGVAVRGLLLAHHPAADRRRSWSRSARSAPARAAAGGCCTLAVHPGGFVRTDDHARPRGRRPTRFGMRAEGVLRGDAAGVARRHGTRTAGSTSRCTTQLPLAAPHVRRARAGPRGARPPPVLAPGGARRGACAAALRAGRARARPRRRGRLRGEELGAAASPATGGGGTRPRSGTTTSRSRSPAAGCALLGAEVAPTAVVVRLGRRVLALAPPVPPHPRARSATARWRLRTRGPALCRRRSRATPTRRPALDAARPGAGRGARGAALAPAPRRPHRRCACGAARRLALRAASRALAGLERRPAGSAAAAPPAAPPRLSGSLATSGSKRPITAHSARSRTAGRAVDRLHARLAAQLGAAAAPPSPSGRTHAHRAGLLPRRELGRVRRAAGSRARASRSARTGPRRGGARPPRAP